MEKRAGQKRKKACGSPEGGKGRDRPCRGAGKEEMEKRKGTGGAGLPYAMPIQLFGIGHTVFATVRPPKPDRTHTPEFKMKGTPGRNNKEENHMQVTGIINCNHYYLPKDKRYKKERSWTVQKQIPVEIREFASTDLPVAIE